MAGGRSNDCVVVILVNGSTRAPSDPSINPKDRLVKADRRLSWVPPTPSSAEGGKGVAGAQSYTDCCSPGLSNGILAPYACPCCDCLASPLDDDWRRAEPDGLIRSLPPPAPAGSANRRWERICVGPYNTLTRARTRPSLSSLSLSGSLSSTGGRCPKERSSSSGGDDPARPCTDVGG